MEEEEELDKVRELELRVQEFEERVDWLKKKYDYDLDAMVKVLSDLTGEPEFKFR